MTENNTPIKLCLTMIVKNENKVILRCLDSLRDWIDYWVICDTGSTDGTQKTIKTYFEQHNISGELLEHEWINFGHNRTLAISASQGKADFALLADADFVLNVVNKDFKHHLDNTQDAYYIRYDNQIEHQQMLLVNINKGLDWKFYGPAHEYIFCQGLDLNACSTFEDITFTHYADGGSRADKYQRDRDLFLAEIKENPKDARSHFYLAQSYFFLGDYDNAIKHYKKRAELGGYQEEVYFSYLQIGSCKIEKAKKEKDQIVDKIMSVAQKRHEKEQKRRNKKKRKNNSNSDTKDDDNVKLYETEQKEINTAKNTFKDAYYTFMPDFIRAYEMRPSRLESMYEFVKFCRENEMYRVGYQVGKMVYDQLRQPEFNSKKKNLREVQLYSGLPEDKLFLNKPVYEWKYWDEFAICAYYNSKFQLAADLWMKMLKEKTPSLNETHVKTNLGYALKAVQKQNLENKLKMSKVKSASSPSLDDQIKQARSTLNSMNIQQVNYQKNYLFFENLDSGGGDIDQADTKDVAKLMEIADKDPKIVAFNTNGWLKHTVNKSLKNWIDYGYGGTYVKKSYAYGHIEGVTPENTQGASTIKKASKQELDPNDPDVMMDMSRSTSTSTSMPTSTNNGVRKICFYCPDYTSIGGSEITIKTLYESLKRVLDKGKYKVKITIYYQEVINFAPEIVITQQRSIQHALQLSEQYKYKVFILLHGPNQFANDHPQCKLLIYNSQQLLEYERHKVSPRIDRMVMHPAVQIERVRSVTKKEFEMDPKINQKREYITFIGSSMYNCIKGSDLFVALAKLNPEKKFLHVSKWSKIDYDNDVYLGMSISRLKPAEEEEKYSRLSPKVVKNLTVVDQTDDIKGIYAKSKILVMPSLVESYGCVGVEACINGVPIVASALPGIKEATYNKMKYVDDYRNVHSFNQALQELEQDYDQYQQAAWSIEQLYLDGLKNSLQKLTDKIEAV